MTERLCIGFGEHEGSCPHVTEDSPLWCSRCEMLRRAHITEQMEAVTERLNQTAVELVSLPGSEETA